MELSKQGWRNLFKIKQWISCRGRTENHLAPLHLLIITVSSQISPTHGCTQPAGQNGWQHGGTEIRCVFEIMFVKMPVKPSSVQLSSVTQSCLTLCNQHARHPCPSPTPGVYSNSCPSSRWCHPTISSSVVPFSSHFQPFLLSGSFQMSQFFASGGQSIGVSASASVLPMNPQDWSPLGWTDWTSLQSKGLSKVFSNTTVQKHKFFGT